MALFGCSNRLPAIKPVPEVDLPRFMGDWYVIAAIPTWIEKDSHNAIESYRLDEDGTVATTFTFNDGSPDGPKKTYTPRGFVVPDTGNALWGMQFIWPFKGEFIIAYLDENYAHTIIARNRRDYVWIMARSPKVDDAKYQELLNAAKEMGYDTTQIRRVPHT